MTNKHDQCEVEFNDWVDRRGEIDPVNPPSMLDMWRDLWELLGGNRDSTLSKEDRELAFTIMQREYTMSKSLYAVLDELSKQFELRKRDVEP